MIMLFLFAGDVTVLLRQIMAEARHLTQVRYNFWGVLEICEASRMKQRKNYSFYRLLSFSPNFIVWYIGYIYSHLLFIHPRLFK